MYARLGQDEPMHSDLLLNFQHRGPVKYSMCSRQKYMKATLRYRPFLPSSSTRYGNLDDHLAF
jgi:hypothetical protein